MQKLCQKKWESDTSIRVRQTKQVCCVETEMNLIQSDEVAYSFELIISIKIQHSMVDPCARLISLANHSVGVSWLAQLNNVNRYTLKNVQSHDNTHASSWRIKGKVTTKLREEKKTQLVTIEQTYTQRTHGTFSERRSPFDFSIENKNGKLKCRTAIHIANKETNKK